MDKDFISLYNREMAYVKELLSEFSQSYPKAAAALRFDQFSVEDPHTSRLIESFAFLNAGVKSVINDDYLELFRLLVPPYLLAPLPRLGILQMLSDEQVDSQIHLDKGTPLEHSVGNVIHYYQTCFDTDILPVRLDKVHYGSLSAEAPPLSVVNGINEQKQALLSFRVSPMVEGNTLEGIGANELRFFINASPVISFLLYEHLLSSLKGVAIARYAKDPDAIYLPASSLKALSTQKDAAVLPIDDQDKSINRLLLEYFLLPEKFLFIELDGLLGANVWETFSNGFNIYLYLSEYSPTLRSGINDDTLQLGCTPVINLFDDENTIFDQKEDVTNVPLQASSEIVGDISVFRINKIEASHLTSGQQVALLPINGATRYMNNLTEVKLPYWQLQQKGSQGAYTHTAAPYLYFVDESGREMALTPGWRVTVSMNCMNRSETGYTNGQAIRFSEAVSGVELSLRCAPENAEPLVFTVEVLKSLVGQLTLQHFEGPNGSQTLQNILRLHNIRCLANNTKMINSIQTVAMSATTTRLIVDRKARLMHGVKIDIVCDYDTEFEGQMYLLSQLLSEFFSCLCTQNTFTQFTLYNSHQTQSFEWPPTMGKSLLI